MDLLTCPKCGLPWQGGEICPSCKFVPIGAGLDRLPKKKKKKHKRYIEPGSSRGFLLFCFIGVFGYAMVSLKPWKDDWEMVKELFGQGKDHDLVGEWQIVKVIPVVESHAWAYSGSTARKGTLDFSKGGAVKLAFLKTDGETNAKGQFVQNGSLVAMRDVRTTEDDAGSIPSVINMKLGWTGNDDVIAVDKSQAIFMHRHKTGNPLLNFIQMATTKPGTKGSEEATGKMGGLIGTVRKEENRAEGSSDQTSDSDRN